MGRRRREYGIQAEKWEMVRERERGCQGAVERGRKGRRKGRG